MGIIEIKDLQYSYPNAESKALKGVDLTIDKGEFVLLTGPSGCGKTTFCRCLNGLIPHFYNGKLIGEATVAGLSIVENPTSKLAQNIGLIFQNPDNQIFALTVEKDVAFGLENLGVEKKQMLEEINWALEMTGINNLRERGTHELSGGQKQRLSIASVLAMRPKILVLDEPTSFLDPMGAIRIFNVLKDLNRIHSITIILIEHRVDLAAQYVDRVILFSNGRILRNGTPEEIFNLEETRITGVGIPKILELSKRLSKRGFRFESIPLSPENFIEQLQNNIQTSEIRQSKKAVFHDLNDFTREFSMSPIISVEDISYAYPSGVQALNNVSLTVHRGEFVAIMGENGAGKTTLVKHFNGLLRPQEGTIYVDGLDVSQVSVAHLARKIGLVFQNPDDQLFSENVESEISFALNNFGFDKDVVERRVSWALNLLDIEKYRNSSPFILSGGERKRVALASVLAWDPDIVVLDEPTIGQDYSQKERLRHFLMQLRTQGKTTIIVTHDVEFVAECNPRIVLMAEGRVITDGTAKEIMTNVDAMKRASVSPPEITKIFLSLAQYGLPADVIDIDEAVEVLVRIRRSGS